MTVHILRRFDWFQCPQHGGWHLRGYRYDKEFHHVRCLLGTYKLERYQLPKRAWFR